MHMKIRQLLVTAFLFAGTGVVLAEDDDICAPFKDGLVDEGLLETMLSAAQDGHLYRIEQSSSRVGFCVDSALKRIKGRFIPLHVYQDRLVTNERRASNWHTIELRADELPMHCSYC